LIFVFRVDSRYDQPLSGVVKGKCEERFYFADGVLIRGIDPGKKEVLAGSELQQRGRDCLAKQRNTRPWSRRELVDA